MNHIFMQSGLVKGPLRTVNESLTFLDRGGPVVGLELDFAGAPWRRGAEHQERHEPDG